nr:MAG TPA: hypothetical protein [Caudoviricetes sp.]
MFLYYNLVSHSRPDLPIYIVYIVYAVRGHLSIYSSKAIDA